MSSSILEYFYELDADWLNLQQNLSEYLKISHTIAADSW